MLQLTGRREWVMARKSVRPSKARNLALLRGASELEIVRGSWWNNEQSEIPRFARNDSGVVPWIHERPF